MADLSSLFPQPQQNQGALSGDPSKTVGLITDLQRAQILNEQAPALGQIPAATLLGQQIGNQTAQIQQQDAARKVVWGALGNSIAGLPNPQEDDVHNAIINLSRVYPQIATQYPQAFSTASDALLNGGKIKTNAAVMVNSVTPPEAGATRVAAPPSATGQPQMQSLAAANVAGMQPTGNPPGFQERAAGGANIDTQLAGNLASAAEGSPTRIGILGNLDNTVDQFTSGPGADWTKVAKSFVNRNVPLPKGWQFDPSSIASQEEFNKQAMNLAQQQFQAIGGTGTDSKFASAFETSPNDTLSNLGNKGIIRLLKGNEDALQAKNQAWLAQANANPNASYRQFSQNFNNYFDPRVFQFKYLSPPDRQSYVQGMDPQEQQKFLLDATVARKNGWITYDMSK
jgi:hypothetical protein